MVVAGHDYSQYSSISMETLAKAGVWSLVSRDLEVEGLLASGEHWVPGVLGMLILVLLLVPECSPRGETQEVVGGKREHVILGLCRTRILRGIGGGILRGRGR